MKIRNHRAMLILVIASISAHLTGARQTSSTTGKADKAQTSAQASGSSSRSKQKSSSTRSGAKTPTSSSTPTVSTTSTPSPTPTPSPSSSPIETPSPSPSATPTPTTTSTPSPTPSPTETNTPSPTPTSIITPITNPTYYVRMESTVSGILVINDDDMPWEVYKGATNVTSLSQGDKNQEWYSFSPSENCTDVVLQLGGFYLAIIPKISGSEITYDACYYWYGTWQGTEQAWLKQQVANQKVNIKQISEATRESDTHTKWATDKWYYAKLVDPGYSVLVTAFRESNQSSDIYFIVLQFRTGSGQYGENTLPGYNG